MKRIFLLSTIFFYCLKVTAQSSGELDPTFGVKGIVKTDFGFIYDYDYATSGKQVILQPDGSMYILIEAGFSLNRQSYLSKRLADGSPDVSYGDNGFSNPVHVVEAHAAQQADGKIVVAGVHGGVYTVARFDINGNLDNSFDTDGQQTVLFPPVTVAIQSDGKIVVAGSITNGNDNDFALARYNADGGIDNTFDDDGNQVTDFGGDDFAAAIAFQSDNKIIVAGQNFNGSPDFAIARYNTQGTLDNEFSGDGKQITDVGSSDDIAKSVAVQSDGKIVVAGYSWNGSTNQFSLVRYNVDGIPDNSFNGDGKQITAFSSEFIANSLSLQSDGKLLVTGYTFSGGNANFAIARFENNGSVDNSFGDGGKQVTDFTNDDHANSIGVQTNGKIVVIGEEDDGSNFAIAQYTSDGILDNTFDEDGKLTDRLHLNQGSTFYTNIAIQNDGKALTAGYTWNGNNYDFAIARYNVNGTLDNTFSSDGRQNTDFNGGDDYARSLAIQNDGKIVVAGAADSNFSVARYNTDGTLDNSFSGGKFTIDFGFEDNAESVTIQSDGKIVLSGSTVNDFDIDTQQSTSDFAVARLNSDGSEDNSFSGDGKLTTNFGFDDRAKSSAIQSDGKIIVVGTKYIRDPGGDNSQVAIARYSSDGTLDNSFSDDGKKLTAIGNDDHANSVAIQTDGKIVVGGNTSFGGTSDSYFALARYNSNGTTDDNFGDGGIVTTYFGSIYKFSNPVVVQADGKIILAGSTNENFTLVRYNTDGTPDNNFSDDGIQVTEASAADDRIEDITVRDDKLYVAGYGKYPGNLGVVARYLLVSEGPVPVSLVDFSAVLQNNTVLLQWQTSNQQNLSDFIIERSADSHNFSSIGKIGANGNSSVSNYSSIDQRPLQGINFYRLKMIDVDGKFTYSKIIAIKIDGDNITLLIFPNPASNILFVQLHGSNENAALQIIDANGRKMREIKVALNGNMSLSLDIKNLPGGAYSLILHNKEKMWIKKFIKE